MTSIHPQHSSMLGKRITPARMTKTVMTDDQAEFLDRFAIEIFTDCVNAGQTFQTALTAIYLSGLQNGLALQELKHG